MMTVGILVVLVFCFLLATRFTGDIQYWPHRYQEEGKVHRWKAGAVKIELFQTNDWSLGEAELDDIRHGELDIDVFSLALTDLEYRRKRKGIYEGWGFLVVATMTNGQKERMILGYNGTFHFPNGKGYFTLPMDERQSELYDEVREIIEPEQPKESG